MPHQDDLHISVLDMMVLYSLLLIAKLSYEGMVIAPPSQEEKYMICQGLHQKQVPLETLPMLLCFFVKLGRKQYYIYASVRCQNPGCLS